MATENKDDTYLLATKCKVQVYRYSEDKLAIYFLTGNAGANPILSKLFKMGIECDLFIDGEDENVYLIDEEHIFTLHEIMVFKTKGKDISAHSIKTARKQWDSLD